MYEKIKYIAFTSENQNVGIKYELLNKKREKESKWLSEKDLDSHSNIFSCSFSFPPYNNFLFNLHILILQCENNVFNFRTLFRAHF